MYYDFYENLHSFADVNVFRQKTVTGDTVTLNMLDLDSGENTGLDIDINGNVYINGVVRYGKSCMIQKIARQIEKKYSPESKLVYFDVKDDYISNFYRSGDKVVSYSDSLPNGPYDYFKFNLIRELRLSEDPDAELKEIVEILLEDFISGGENDFFWKAAGMVFRGFIATIIHTYNNCPTNIQIISDIKHAGLVQLINHLLRWNENKNIVRDYLGGTTYKPDMPMSKMTQSILACLSEILDLFGGNFYSDGQDTITEFIAGKYGRRIFFEYDYARKASSNVFFRYLLHKIIQNKLSMYSSPAQKIVMVLDEIGVLDAPFGMMDGLLIGAARGLQFIVCSQSLERLYGISHNKNIEHSTNALLSGFATIVTFHTGDIETEKKLQEIFGERYIQRIQLGFSRRDAAKQDVISEKWITSEKLACMGVGEFYAKNKNQIPVHGRLIL